jgi:hypothetical protein
VTERVRLRFIIGLAIRACATAKANQTRRLISTLCVQVIDLRSECCDLSLKHVNRVSELIAARLQAGEPLFQFNGLLETWRRRLMSLFPHNLERVTAF